MIPGQTFIPFMKFKGCLIPEGLLRGIVSRNAAILYGVLARFSGKDGLCFVGQGKLAIMFRVCTRTVQRWLSELVRGRFLRATRRGLMTRTNSYDFLWHAGLESSQLNLPLGPAPADPAAVVAPSPAPAMAEDLPCRKPVEKERRQEVPLRQKCRVSGGASLSEEGQVFSAPSIVAVISSSMSVEISDGPEPISNAVSSLKIPTSTFSTANEGPKCAAIPTLQLPGYLPSCNRPGKIPPMTPVKTVLAALPGWLLKPFGLSGPSHQPKPTESPTRGLWTESDGDE